MGSGEDLTVDDAGDSRTTYEHCYRGTLPGVSRDLLEPAGLRGVTVPPCGGGRGYPLPPGSSAMSGQRARRAPFAGFQRGGRSTGCSSSWQGNCARVKNVRGEPRVVRAEAAATAVSTEVVIEPFDRHGAPPPATAAPAQRLWTDAEPGRSISNRHLAEEGAPPDRGGALDVIVTTGAARGRARLFSYDQLQGHGCAHGESTPRRDKAGASNRFARGR